MNALKNILYIFAAVIIPVLLSTGSEVIKTGKIKICFLPLYTDQADLEELTEEINAGIMKNPKKFSSYEMPPHKDFIIFLSDNNIKSSKDYNVILREKIFNAYKCDYTVIGKIYSEENKTFIAVFILSVTSGRLISSFKKEFAKSNPQSASDTALDFVQNRHDALKKSIPQEYIFSKQNYEWNEFDIIKRTSYFCFIPFASADETIKETTGKYNDGLKKTIFLNDEEYGLSEKILKELKIKDYSDYNNDIRKKIFADYKVSRIVTGTVYLRDKSLETKLKIIDTQYGAILTNISLWSNISGLSSDYNLKSVKLRLINSDNFNSEKIDALVNKWDSETGGKTISGDFEYPSTEESGEVLTVYHNDNSKYSYYIHLPPDYDKNGYSYPLLLYLHGGGGYSDSISPVILLSSPFRPIYSYKDKGPVIDKDKLKNLNKYLKGSICIIPQLSGKERKWSPEKLLNILIEVTKKYPVDTNRLYVTGESQGGIGAWTFTSAMYKRIAALAPICAYGFGAETLADMPVWTFHNFDDTTIYPLKSIVPALELIIPGDIKIMKGYPHQNNDPALAAPYDCTISYFNNKLGSWEKGVIPPKGQITYTLYRSGGHDAWTKTYENTDLWVWMYARTK